jgi:hypothetical protein
MNTALFEETLCGWLTVTVECFVVLLEYSWYLGIWIFMSAGKMFCTNRQILYWHSKKNYIFHLAKTYHRLHYVAQTVSERCFIAHCSLFMNFTHCRHNSIVYRVSKQHKHHSTYLSMCHCNEILHFATFSPGSTSTPLSYTRLHLTYGLGWFKNRPCTDALRYLYVYRISTVGILLSDGGKTGVYICLFIII